MSKDKVKWEQVRKWVARDGLKTTWKAYGMPEVLDPFTSRFADVDPMPKWDIPEKVMISTTITGAFFSKRSNPNQPISVDEIRDSAEECIKAGAPNIHIHVRDDGGWNVLDPQRFRDVIVPLRQKYPEVMFDGCLVAVNDDESAKMQSTMEMGLFDALPVNTTAICCGDSMFFKAPHVIIEKARLAQEAGAKPIISVYDDGDIDNARRFLVASGLLKKPYYWLILPALPGCSPMHNPRQMVEALMRMVNTIKDIDEDAFILVCAAGRASTYLATFAMLLGLHVRVGMEDTLWPYPHRDDIIQRNVDHFEQMRQIAHLLGRELMTPVEYRKALGLPAKSLFSEKAVADLKGKLALVTGGARGLGQAAAVELARCGARVAVADRKAEAAQETARLCNEHTPGALAFTYNQAEAASVEQCVNEVTAALGGIDLLFANAGTGAFAPIADMKKEDWNFLIQVNLNGTFYVCQDVAQRMIRQGRGGRIVLTASSGATVMCDQLGAYCASKAGVLMLMKHMASELGNYRINVNAIQPGVVATGMTGPMLAEEKLQRMLTRQTPVGRWGRPEDVAKLVAFLLSDDAAYINGEGIMIDGGSTLHGYPRWFALDYSKDNECDWNQLFTEYPYKP